jgi:hypothetical protein
VNQHLSDEQMTACLAGEGSTGFSAHLADCAQCRAEAQALSGAIAGFRSALDMAAPRVMSWDPVALAQESPMRPRLQWASALAAVAVLLVLASVLFTRAPRPETSKSREAADEALLLQVQTDVGRYIPRALVPAQSIADERTTILVARSKQSSQSSNRRVNQ